MLKIVVPACNQLWDEVNEQFISSPETVLELEHSLVSLSKWESKWCKPFINRDDKTYEEMIDYVRCMTLNSNKVNDVVYSCLTDDNIKEINEYIEAPMTATWFSKGSQTSSHSGEQITSELIYYWMIALQIPFECQKWHLNRLLTLVRVCNIKNQPDKKMSKRDILNRNAALNAARRKKFNSKG